jgi:hypothetical protein
LSLLARKNLSLTVPLSLAGKERKKRGARRGDANTWENDAAAAFGGGKASSLLASCTKVARQLLTTLSL